MLASIKKRGSELKFQTVDSGMFLACPDQALTRSERSKLLNQNGLNEPTYQEVLSLIQRKPEITTKLAGKWLDIIGNAPYIKGIYTFDQNGELTKGETNTERNVCVCKSIPPLSMFVCSEYIAGMSGFRFIIDDSTRPDKDAQVLFGVINLTRTERLIKRR